MNTRIHFFFILLLATSPAHPIRANIFDTCPIPGDGFFQKFKKTICIAGIAWLITEVGMRRFNKMNQNPSPLKEDPAGFVKSIVRQTVREMGVVTEHEFFEKVESVLSRRYPELNKETSAAVRKIAHQQKQIMIEPQVGECIEKAITQQGLSEESVKQWIMHAIQESTLADQRSWLEEALMERNPELTEEDMRIIAHEVALDVFKETMPKQPKHLCNAEICEEDIKAWINEFTQHVPTQDEVRNIIEEALLQRSPELGEEHIRTIAREVSWEVIKEVAAKHADCAFGNPE